MNYKISILTSLVCPLNEGYINTVTKERYPKMEVDTLNPKSNTWFYIILFKFAILIRDGYILHHSTCYISVVMQDHT